LALSLLRCIQGSEVTVLDSRVYTANVSHIETK
jgi:hypothetical protein